MEQSLGVRVPSSALVKHSRAFVALRYARNHSIALGSGFTNLRRPVLAISARGSQMAHHEIASAGWNWSKQRLNVTVCNIGDKAVM